MSELIKFQRSKAEERFITENVFSYDGDYNITGSGENTQIHFLTSGTFIPKKNLLIDVFAVGGGSSGKTATSSSGTLTAKGGDGGNGGFTETGKSIAVIADTPYSIVIGSGGSFRRVSNSLVYTNAGYSEAFGIRADGATVSSGGSGGGIGSVTSGEAGSRGKANGVGGQETTTRAFGDADGELFAGGGGGGGYGASGGLGGGGGGGAGGSGNGTGESGEPNTGGGGGGGGLSSDGATVYYPASGGSGIVIIRKAA